MRRPLRNVAAWAILALSSASCASGPLQPIPFPTADTPLQYGLDPGSRLRGSIRLGSTHQVDGSTPRSRSLSFEADLEVLGGSPGRDGVVVRARLTDLDIDWALDRDAEVSPEDFRRAALRATEGLVVNFVLDDHGHVLHMPLPPPRASESLQELISSLTWALESSFVPLPPAPLKAGTPWIDDDVAVRDGKESSRTTMTRWVRHRETAEEFAELERQSSRTTSEATPTGLNVRRAQAEVHALFSTRGYVASLEAQQRILDGHDGVTITRIWAEWRSDGAPRPAEPAPAPHEAGVQDITDPCDLDYVGPQACTTDTEVIPTLGEAPPQAR